MLKDARPSVLQQDLRRTEFMNNRPSEETDIRAPIASAATHHGHRCRQKNESLLSLLQRPIRKAEELL